MIREFRLSQPGSGSGVSCDASGAFIGAVPLLMRSQRLGGDQWEPRDCCELSKQVSKHFGLPIDISSKSGGIKAISNALNEGDIARAQIATVLLGIPDPPTSSRGRPSEDQMVKFIRDLFWSGILPKNDLCLELPRRPMSSVQQEVRDELTKAGYNPAEPRGYHARWIHGDETDAASGATRSVPVRPSGAQRSSTTDDPTAEAAQRAADSQGNPVKNQHEGSERSFGSRLRHGVETVLSDVGQAEIAESNSNLALADAATHAVSGWLRDFFNHSADPWIGPDGRPVQIPVISTGDPNSDAGAVIAHAILEPNAPLARPGTNADRILALIGLASAGVTAAHLAVGPSAAGPATVPEPAPPAINRPFIIPRAKLPTDLDASQPIGRFEVPENLIPGTKGFGDYAHDRIGALLQDAAGDDAELILNTSPNARGVDVQVPVENIEDMGFEYAEIKPRSRSGRYRFNNQVMNVWDLEGRVQAISYDEKGNIYYGFPEQW